MSENTILLILILAAVVFTFWLYIWRAVRQVKNMNDERWNLVLLKAKSVTEITYWILILSVAILIMMPEIQKITFSLNRILTYTILFFGFRNLVELIGLFYYERTL